MSHENNLISKPCRKCNGFFKQIHPTQDSCKPCLEKQVIAGLLRGSYGDIFSQEAQK